MLSYAFVLLHASILLAGFTGVLGRLITLNEGLLVWYRVMMASVFFFIYLAITKGRIRLPIKDIIRIAWVGLLLCIHWLLFYGSIKYSNVSIGVVCFASVLTIENRRVGSDYPLMTFLFYEIEASFVIMSAFLPLYLSFFPVPTIVPSTSDFIYLLLLSSFCTVGMFSLQIEALKRLSSFTVNLSYNLEPVYSIILAMIIFNEAKDLNFSFYVGLILICASVILQSYVHWNTFKKIQAVAKRSSRKN